MSFYRDQRVYLVGGSKGIGFAAARQLRERGAGTILFARGEDALREAAEDLRANLADGDDGVGWQTLDVADPEAVERAFEAAADAHGPPDIVINCAGLARPDYFENIAAEDFDQTLQVNLYGTRHVAAAAYPYLRDRDGHLVNVSSVAGYIGVFGYTDYSASKYGVIGFSEALRAEARQDDVDVSVLCPPDTRTPGFEEENASKPPETRAVSEGGGLAEPDEVATELLRGIRREQFMILPGTEPKLVYWASRIAPGLVRFFMDRDVDSVTDDQPDDPGTETVGESGGVSQPTPAGMLLYILAISSLACAVPAAIGEWLLGVSGPVFVPAVVLIVALLVELALDFLRGPHRGARLLQMAAGGGMIALGLFATQMTLTIEPEPIWLLQTLRYGFDAAWLGLGGLLTWHGR
jgi:short-subunit dehydrogenase